MFIETFPENRNKKNIPIKIPNIIHSGKKIIFFPRLFINSSMFSCIRGIRILPFFFKYYQFQRKLFYKKERLGIRPYFKTDFDPGIGSETKVDFVEVLLYLGFSTGRIRV
jgi:hypothetical protein